MVDEGSQFRNTFAELTAIHDVQLEKSGIQSHNSLGIGERHHKPLRDTYRKLKFDHPKMQRQVLVALAIKAVNDTLGPEGIVPSALVFGEFPSLHSFLGPMVPRPTLAERAFAAQEARRHMSKHMAAIKIERSLKHRTPSAANSTYQAGDKVFVWGEKIVENRFGEWLGPYTVTSYDHRAKIVLAQANPQPPQERYYTTQVKPFLEQAVASKEYVRTLYTSLKGFSSEFESSMHLTEVID